MRLLTANDIEDEDEFEDDWGTSRSGEGRGRFAERHIFYFEPGNCPCLSNRSEEVGIARPRGEAPISQSFPNRTRT
jgi:hypothetical protein